MYVCVIQCVVNQMHVSEMLISHVFYTDITKADVYYILSRA
jgi:hypothetical protein